MHDILYWKRTVLFSESAIRAMFTVCKCVNTLIFYLIIYRWYIYDCFPGTSTNYISKTCKLPFISTLNIKQSSLKSIYIQLKV